jgi:hypothetical protein
MKATTFAVFVLLAAFSPLGSHAGSVVYRFTMHLYVPRVYNNAHSTGYRKVQKQKIVGYVTLNNELAEGENEPSMRVWDMKNLTHKVQGEKVWYRSTDAEEVMWRYIGNNGTRVFKKPQVMFSLDLDPSYNIGADEPDNTLLIRLSGRGTSWKYIRGGVTGQIGCGCSAYGHTSPTRTFDCKVSDITPLYGTFKMKRTSGTLSALICR